MNLKEDVTTLLSVMSVSGVIGLVVGITRGIIQTKHGTFAAFLRGVLASIFVATLVSWGLADTALSVTSRGVIIGIASYIADDILLGLMSLGALAGRDPLGFIERLTAAYRGQAAKKDEQP